MNQAVNADWKPEADPEYGRALIPYMLKRHRWLLLGGLMLGGLVFGLASLFAPPAYSTRGILHVTKSGTAAGFMGTLAGLGGGVPLADEFQIIASRDIGWQVIDELGLQVDVYDPKSADAPWQRVLGKLGLGGAKGSREEQYSRLVICDVEVDPDRLGSTRRWITADAAGAWRSGKLEGGPGDRFESLNYGFLPQFGSAHADGGRYLLTIYPDHEAWASYISSLTITRAGPEASMLSVRFSHHNPLIARRVVDLVLQKYLDYTYDITYGSYDVLLEFIAEQTAAAEQSLDDDLGQLAQYQEQHGVYAETVQGATAIQSLAQLSRQQTEARIQLLQIDSVLEMIASRTPAEVSATIQAPATALPIEGELVSQLAEAVRGLEDARQTRTEAHPEVVRMQDQIGTVLGQIEDSLRSARQGYELALRGVAGDIGTLKSQLADLPATSGGITLLRGEIEANQQILALLKEQEAQTKLQRASTSTDVRVLDYPPMPARRDSPRIARDGALGVFLGLLAAILAVLLIESYRRDFRTLRELRAVLGLPVLAVLPGHAGRAPWRPGTVDQTIPLLWRLLDERQPVAVVHLDTARPCFDLCWALSGPDEGAKQPAVLIDLDPLQALLTRALSREPGPGLTDVATGAATASDTAIQIDRHRRLLRYGTGQPAADQISRLVGQLAAEHGRVIACLPPPSHWAGVEGIRSLLSQCVLTVSQGRASRADIAAALSRLEQLGLSVRGIVVTRFDARRDPLASVELAHVPVVMTGRA